MEEDASRPREVLGDDGVQEPRRDATLHDEPAEAASGRGLLVVVERVSVAGQLAEELDVPLEDDAGSARDVANLRHAGENRTRPAARAPATVPAG